MPPTHPPHGAILCSRCTYPVWALPAREHCEDNASTGHSLGRRTTTARPRSCLEMLPAGASAPGRSSRFGREPDVSDSIAPIRPNVKKKGEGLGKIAKIRCLPRGAGGVCGPVPQETCHRMPKGLYSRASATPVGDPQAWPMGRSEVRGVGLPKGETAPSRRSRIVRPWNSGQKLTALGGSKP